jgi:uncharacterized tellurite resistance protein B-like protein
MLEQPMAVKLIQILVATAWLDGQVQPEEQRYLQKVAQAAGIADDETLKPLLYGLKPVSKADCYAWIDEYLGAHPTSEACQQLLEALSGLIYSDGDVAAEEAKLLTQIQRLDPEQSEPHQFRESVTQAIQQLYQRWVNH